MFMPATGLIIQRIAEFGVVMVDVDLPLREAVFEGGHQIDFIADGSRLRLFNPGIEGVEHVVLIGQVMRLHEGHIGRGCGHTIHVVVDAADQFSGEQEIGRDDDFLVAQLQRHFEAAAHRWVGHAGIDGFGPAKAHVLGHDAREACGLGVGERIRCAAPHDDQHGVIEIAVMNMIHAQCFEDAGLKRGDHLRVQAKFTTVADSEAGIFFTIGGEHRGDIVLGVGRGEKHPRHGHNLIHARIAQAVEAHMDVGRGIFEKSVFHRDIGVPGAHAFCEKREFFFSGFCAAAMAADHDAGFCRCTHPGGPLFFWCDLKRCPVVLNCSRKRRVQWLSS